jgi:hypothetical protein
MSFNYAFKKILDKNNFVYSKTINLYFRNASNKTITVNIEIFNKNKKIYEKWFNSLVDIIKNDSVVYSKNFSLVGGFSNNRKPDLIVKQLLHAIDVIKKSSWYHEYNLINEKYENLLYSFDRELLNHLHHHFELLHGQVWEPSKFLEKATGEERFAISHLNLCCHELEAYYDSKNKKDNEQDHCLYFYFSVCGVPKFKELTKEDKMNFSRKVNNGMVYLHYAQTGKTWHEAYIDNDDIVETNNITEHRLISGEFSSYIGPDFEFSMDKKFKEYIEKRGFSWDDPDLAIGYCPIGQILKVNNIDISDYQACQKILEEYDDFYGIELDNGLNKNYDYKSDSLKYYELMCDVFSTWRKS